jgi:hypothetical protein
MSNMNLKPLPSPDLRTDEFTMFWETLDKLLESRKKSGLLYGEVVQWWEQYRQRVNDASRDRGL